MTKLILGTAQFGSNYGIKKDGQPSIEEIEKIARVAWDGGIRTVHTSQQYNLPYICSGIFSDFDVIHKDLLEPEYFTWNDRQGKSVYSPSEIDKFYGGLIIPVNILDERFKSTWMNKGKMTLIARSIFLQGLLLMEDLPHWLPQPARMQIMAFNVMCAKRGIKRYEAALGWVLGLDEIDHVIVGVNSAEQLQQLLNVTPLKWDYDFHIDDENVLDPRRWPK